MATTIDLYPPPLLIEKLLEPSGFKQEDIMALTFSSYESYLFEHVSRGPRRWIMTLGLRTSRTDQPGLSFCPRCLAEDPVPYFRKQWRLAFITACQKHRCLLLDQCPHCHSKVYIHRWDKGNYDFWIKNPITHCYYCRKPLTVTQPLPSPDHAQLRFEAWLIHALHEGGCTFSAKPIDGFLFFEGLDMLAKVLLQRRKSDRLHTLLHNHGFLRQAIQINTTHRRFETLPLSIRHDVLRALCWLLSDWPDRFLNLCKEAQFSSSYLFDQCNKKGVRRIPFWLWEPVYINNHRKYYAPSPVEIANAAKFLSAKNSLTKSKLSLALGISWINNPTKDKYSYLFNNHSTH